MKSVFLSYFGTFLFVIFFNAKAGSLQDVFTHVYQVNYWRDQDSASGSGSNFSQTETIRAEIPKLLKNLCVRTMFDCPCGDFCWMRLVDLNFLKTYIGADIVKEIAAENTKKYASEKCAFCCLDIVHDSLPKVDLILCRDCLVHLSFQEIFTAIENIKKSGSKYFLTTTFTRNIQNQDRKAPHWRPLNLQLPPFNLKKPVVLINEHCTEANGKFSDKCLGLWLVEDL